MCMLLCVGTGHVLLAGGTEVAARERVERGHRSQRRSRERAMGQDACRYRHAARAVAGWNATAAGSS